MSENTNIEWCDHTFNPWVGCTKVSPACDHCYAEGWAKRSGSVQWGGERRRTAPANWAKPLKWQANAAGFMAQHGRRQRVFCASLADVFDNEVPPEWRLDLFKLIAATPDLDWLLLTKRIGNARSMSQIAMGAIGVIHKPMPPNVWIGATICNQAEADRDIRKLLNVPAKVRFLSMEPLLGSVDLTNVPGPESGHGHHEFSPIITINALKRADWQKPTLDWVIVGGESGPGARPMHPDWARSLRDQSQSAGVPFLFKQWGEWLPWHHFGCARIEDPPEQTQFKTMEFVDGDWLDVGYPDCWASKDGDIDDMQCVGRVGKKKSGRLLDGAEHNEFPKGV